MEKSINKSINEYYCKKCDYITSIKCNYTKHLLTAKHQNDNNGNINGNKKYKSKNVCENCGRDFSYRSGLSRHLKKCLDEPNKKIEKNENNDTELKITSKMLKNIIEQNNALQRQLIEISKQKQTINYTTNCNNKMTINVFLNEMCKDAMNLTDFINQLDLSLDDLMYTKDNGYIKGISNIFVKNLQYMKPTERPIHCSDKKRLQFYVKDEDKWEKDNEKIDKTITAVSHKQIQQIKEWEKEHPDWNTKDHTTELYMKMVQQVMGGNKCVENNTENIKKTISGVLEIKNAMI